MGKITTKSKISDRDLKAPLARGWKRETTFKSITKNFEIEGEVCYYSPGSKRKLRTLEQIQNVQLVICFVSHNLNLTSFKVLHKQVSRLTVKNFCFATQSIVGDFIQYHGDRIYKKFTEVAMSEHLETVKRLRAHIDLRKCEKLKKLSCNDNANLNPPYNPLNPLEAESCSSSDSESNVHSEIESVVILESNAVDAPPESRIRLKRYGSEDRNFYDDNGFIYSINNNGPAVKNYYFRCKNEKKFDCKVRAISKNKNLNDTILKGEHSHPGHIADVEAMKFRYNLDKEIQKSPLEFGREVYLNTMNSMVEEIDVTNVPDKKELSSFMYRRKLKFVPKLPKTVAEFENMINNENYGDKFKKDKQKQQFYRGTWKSEKGGDNIAFISETVLRIVLLMSSIMFRMDGTFKVLPRHIKFGQLFIVSVIYRDKSYPLAYILMQRRNFEAYDNIFTKLSELVPSHLVSEVMADYEAATRKAVLKHFPKANLVGCWFHYVQAINRIAKRFGLLKDDKFADVIKYISALALLPHNYVSDGFNYIDGTVSNSRRWDRFRSYWFRQWKGANISVYRLVDRTNNYAESLNKSLNVLIGARHPNIWKLIERINLMDMDYSNMIKKASRGKITVTYKKQVTTALNTQIKRATEIFDRTKDIGRFLQEVTYDVKLEILLKERLNIHSTYEEEHDYDEIIPNTFNSKTMRKRTHSKN